MKRNENDFEEVGRVQSTYLAGQWSLWIRKSGRKRIQTPKFSHYLIQKNEIGS